MKVEKRVHISAAPELLEVAQMVNEVIQSWRESGREPSYGQWENLQDVAKAAIAKATQS